MPGDDPAGEGSTGAASAGDGGPIAGDPDRPVLVVSACLLGVECNHRGAASPRPAVAELAERFDLIPVCPEVEGGLPVPRSAAERSPDGRVVTVDGHDVTDAYARGAEVAVALARSTGAVGAVLKARSPSCGTHHVYDGSFTRTLVPGQGTTAEALRADGVEVVDEEDVAAGRLPGTDPVDRPRDTAGDPSGPGADDRSGSGPAEPAR